VIVLNSCEGLEPRRRGDHGVALGFEELGDQLTDLVLVVHDQDPRFFPHCPPLPSREKPEPPERKTS